MTTGCGSSQPCISEFDLTDLVEIQLDELGGVCFEADQVGQGACLRAAVAQRAVDAEAAGIFVLGQKEVRFGGRLDALDQTRHIRQIFLVLARAVGKPLRLLGRAAEPVDQLHLLRLDGNPVIEISPGKEQQGRVKAGLQAGCQPGPGWAVLVRFPIQDAEAPIRQAQQQVELGNQAGACAGQVSWQVSVTWHVT